MRTVWGSINSDGTINTSSGDFSMKLNSDNTYTCTFNPPFNACPAMVGSQNRSDYPSQNALDNIVFSHVNVGAATILCGDMYGNKSARSFGFIAVGT
jgi:hypothetical protein